jgi:hypothetical protein
MKNKEKEMATHASPITTAAQSSHPTGGTKIATPDLTVASFIGAAQGKLSLGLTKTVPGPQTLTDAIQQGPANHVPSPVLTALESYMKTSQCATTISDARLVAEFAIAKYKSMEPTSGLKPQWMPAAPKLSSQATRAQVSAAAAAAIGQVPQPPVGIPVQAPKLGPAVGQIRKVTNLDKANAVAAVLAAFPPTSLLGGALLAYNAGTYAMWGDNPNYDDNLGWVYFGPQPTVEPTDFPEITLPPEEHDLPTSFSSTSHEDPPPPAPDGGGEGSDGGGGSGGGRRIGDGVVTEDAQ